MRVQLTLLRGRTAAPANIEVTADGTATVGDLARAIATSPDSGLAAGPNEALTLTVGRGESLSPMLQLSNSGIVSGHHIEVVADTARREEPAARLRVIEGPDTGVEVLLRRGRSSVGRAQDSDVRLSDRLVSKDHALFEITDRIDVVDTNSANGVEVGGLRVSKESVNPGDRVRFGSTIVTVEPLVDLTAGQASSDASFIRSPSVLVRPQAQLLEAPEVPQEPAPAPFPLLAIVSPLIMGAVLYLFTRSGMSLIFVALSPLLMIGSWASQWFSGRRQRKAQTRAFGDALELLDARFTTAADEQRDRLRKLYPSLSDSVASLGELGADVWIRRKENPEFGTVRLGQGDIPALTRMEFKARQGRADLIRKLSDLLVNHATVTQAPVIANLAECGSIGVAGTLQDPALVARGIALQLAITHSPVELQFTCITSTAKRAAWRWLEWLPHSNRPSSPLGQAPLASDLANARRVLELLETLTRERLSTTKPAVRGPLSGKEEKSQVPITPLVLLVVDEAPGELGRLTWLAEHGPDAGVHLLWVGATVRDLPAACRAFVDLDTSTAGFVRAETTVGPLLAEGVDTETAGYAARQLASLVDAAELESDASDVPALVSLVGLLGSSRIGDPAQLVAHWTENGSLVLPDSVPVPRDEALPMRAFVGHTGAQPFALDLRAQGPHALVGGTTGAGKSEFLQAWLLGMAVNYAPSRLTFLLVDYKGGTAFAHCVQLPHCVGLVTDLNPHLVARVLLSLRAELVRREHLFNARGVKDIIEFEKTGEPACPPALVIVIDEFAALKKDMPEFVDGVIDIAQRGRSLGVHLILATQRPTGVIDDNIVANTNLRISLRMNDESDAKDIIGHPMSAHFDPSLPGRGAARVGPGRIHLFQSAYPGARTPDRPERPPIVLQEFDFGSRRHWKAAQSARPKTGIAKDIERVVEWVSSATTLAQLPPCRRSWLDPLQKVYDLASITQRRDSALALGVVDQPASQSQEALYFEPEEHGNLIISGVGGSGKTTVLRTLGQSAARTPSSGPIHVYGLDFAGGGLLSMEVLPHVGAIISGNDTERVRRLILTLDSWVQQRAAAFATVNATTLAEFRALSGRPQEPRILVLLDGFASFYEEYQTTTAAKQTLYTTFARVLAEGRGVGIHWAVTTNRATVHTTISSAFLRRLVLRQSAPEDYRALGVDANTLGPESPPGRGVWSPGGLEVQVASLGGSETSAEQAEQMKKLAAAARTWHIGAPVPIRRLEPIIELSSLKVDGRPVIGVSNETLEPVTVPTAGVVLIGSAPRGGGTNTLTVLAQTSRDAMPGVELTLLSARPSQLGMSRMWQRTASGAAEVRSVISMLVAENSGRTRAIFIEGAPDLASDGLHDELTALVAHCRASNSLLVAEGHLDRWGAESRLKWVFKPATGILLLQSNDPQLSLIDSPPPPLGPSDQVPGRGYWVSNGPAEKIQVPLATHG